MKLTLQERKVLTLMTDISVQDFPHFARKYVDLDLDEIREVAEGLKKKGLVEVLEGADNEDLIYEHSKKVTPDMLDKETDNLAKYGIKDPDDPVANWQR